MYFWRIEKLKDAMAAGPLTDREVLPYFIAFAILTALGTSLPGEAEFNHWETVGAVWSVLLAGFGSYFIYSQNGGARGQYLLQRYFALGWVVGVRWVAAAIPI